MSDPERIFRAVDFPIPFLPTNPITSPFLTTGILNSLNEFTPNWCIFSSFSSSLRFRISIASKGQTLMQMPHPMQSSSEMSAIFSSSRWMQSSPLMFTGQSLMHSSPHFLD